MYLRLSADYLEPQLVDEQTGRTTPEALGLSEPLRQEIHSWNSQYQKVIPLDSSERSRPGVIAMITSLDEIGLELARAIETEVPGGAKVGYYSEGLLKRVV